MNIRVFIFTLFTCLISFLPLNAADKDNIDFFVRCESAKTSITAGDSILVNVVLYSSHPFQKADCTTKNIKIKGGHSRLVPRRGDRQQQKVRLEGGIYYAIVWQQYMVGSDKVEEIRIPEMHFDATFVVYDSEEMYSPFDPFGFFSAPRRKSHTATSRCKSDPYTISVEARPKRSTQEVISSGARVI